jgi:predicted unusual protein kinase regulating ubiquinone biosynthesis (AarF/ABC1/UbiB family)
MSKTPRRLKPKALPRTLTASIAGLRAGGALAVDGAWQKLRGRDDSHSSKFAKAEARRLVEELGRLKGTYVKVGQMFALLGEHFLPPVLTAALHELEAKTDPLPWEDMEETLRTGLGARWRELDIEKEAFAAASLAQVHRAKIRSSGKQICLKVQYPGLAEVIDADFDAVVQMLRLARWIPAGRDLDDWLESMRTHLHHEIDYHREAAMSRQMATQVAGLEAGSVRYHVPALYPEYCGDKILAMDYLPGKSVNEPSIARLSLARRNDLALAMLDLFFYELYEWGVLQTDPNFGNYLIQTDREGDELVLLDFGSMLEGDEDFLFHLRRLIAAGLEENETGVVEGLIGLGCLHKDASAEGRALFADFCLQLLEPLRPPQRLPAERLNRRGHYRWATSGLMQRAGKKAVASTATRHFTAPSRDFALIARKLTGVFTFISVLGAEFNGYEAVSAHIARWRQREAHGQER